MLHVSLSAPRVLECSICTLSRVQQSPDSYYELDGGGLLERVELGGAANDARGAANDARGAKSPEFEWEDMDVFPDMVGRYVLIGHLRPHRPPTSSSATYVLIAHLYL
jgi:hypothetical protein